ncbi:uncharacterized protein Bfra_003194 [Botrytis fragariae]|uniref:Uncharacterized protein n=1 Tax=Botrytis fragariae TaxID=1964551 RepID=A0A8H6B0C1_9HELO|nr:uncharacterized protein Bfra_003194 [Botrytis fragariae]KAF5876787.1 hypothetical protein Bfra_003194 [Botrytis fragariae]
MSPLPDITEITGPIINGTDITQVELTIMETIIFGFFAPLGIICMIFIITSWIAILIISIYETINDWRRGSLDASERRPMSKPTNIYLNSVNESARNSLLDVKKWSEHAIKGVEFFSKNDLPNYGTITWMSRDEIDALQRSRAVSKEMMGMSLGDDQV